MALSLMMTHVRTYFLRFRWFLILQTANYYELCTVEVDLSYLAGTSAVESVLSSKGVYYKINYDIIMLFGGTEIQAQVAWKEGGVEKR